MSPSHPPSSPPSNKAERIAKVMAAAGLCSRREAESWILAGRVTVNDQRLTTPACTVTQADRIAVDGRPLSPQAAQKAPRLWILHKPVDYVTTARDPQNRPTVFDLVPKKIGRVISVGRLDLNSEGLLLLTNDGGLARAMELPRTGIPRCYRVRVYGDVSDAMLEPLASGITYEGISYGPIMAEIEKRGKSNSWIVMTLHEGKNREIRNVMRALGLVVNRLVRMAYGPFELGDLPLGKTREVPEKMVQRFMTQIGYIPHAHH